MNLNPETFATAKPFPHVVDHDGLMGWDLDGILREWPGPDAWKGGDHANSQRKRSLNDWTRFGPVTTWVFQRLLSRDLLDWLETLAGCPLYADPTLFGAGLHETTPPGRLGVHLDFNRHPTDPNKRRALNLLLYLNPDWQESYGGHLELWRDPSDPAPAVRVLPLAGCAVIFEASERSWHGHPQGLTCPPGFTRRSLAVYYYTDGPPTRPHSTVYHPTRPYPSTPPTPLGPPPTS